MRSAAVVHACCVRIGGAGTWTPPRGTPRPFAKAAPGIKLIINAMPRCAGLAGKAGRWQPGRVAAAISGANRHTRASCGVHERDAGTHDRMRYACSWVRLRTPARRIEGRPGTVRSAAQLSMTCR